MAIPFHLVAITLWADDLIKTSFLGITFFGTDFFESLHIVPWISLSYLFYGFYHLQTPGVFLRNRPKYAAWTRFFGAILNIGLCWYLIPIYGAIGAAYATCISFGLMALLMYYINRYLVQVKLELKNLSIILSLLIMSYVCFSTYEDSFFANMIMLGIYISIIFYFKIISIKSLNKIIS